VFASSIIRAISKPFVKNRQRYGNRCNKIEALLDHCGGGCVNRVRAVGDGG
jgi:hypothetical protein